MTAIVVGGAVVITGLACVVALMALALVRRAKREIRAAHLATVAAVQQAADEQAGKESALRLLEESRQLRRVEFDEFTTRVAALRWAYDKALNKYRRVLRLERDDAGATRH